MDIDQTSYRMIGDCFSGATSMILLSAFRKAMELDHKLPETLQTMRGMSGLKYRYLVNRLVEDTPDARYLEVGSWAGSTACAAMFGNKAKIQCIDNWAEFGGPKDEFFRNVSLAKNPLTDFNFIESDFRKVDFSQLGKFNIYLFDGPHTEQDQYDGVQIAQAALGNVFTLIVDDWNWPAVRKGTYRALQDLMLKVEFAIEIRSTQTDGNPKEWLFEKSEWHNGYFIGVCRKAFGVQSEAS